LQSFFWRSSSRWNPVAALVAALLQPCWSPCCKPVAALLQPFLQPGCSLVGALFAALGAPRNAYPPARFLFCNQIFFGVVVGVAKAKYRNRATRVPSTHSEPDSRGAMPIYVPQDPPNFTSPDVNRLTV